MAARSGHHGRGALAGLTLLGVWVAVYWLWPTSNPTREAPITFDRAAGLDIAPDPSDPEPAFKAAGGTSPAQRAPTRATTSGADNSGDAAGVNAHEATDAVIAPQFIERAIHAGDTMQTIAAASYGDAALWTAIAHANPLTDPANLRAGMTLRIPLDPANVQGNPARSKKPTPEKPLFPIEYVVQKNDSLSDIAKKLYGRATLYRRIFDANRAVLKSPDEIRQGMRLIIPPPPETSAPESD